MNPRRYILARLPRCITWAEVLDTRVGWVCLACRLQRYGRTHGRVWIRTDAMPAGRIPVRGDAMCVGQATGPERVCSWDPVERVYRVVGPHGETVYHRISDVPPGVDVVSTINDDTTNTVVGHLTLGQGRATLPSAEDGLPVQVSAAEALEAIERYGGYCWVDDGGRLVG